MLHKSCTCCVGIPELLNRLVQSFQSKQAARPLIWADSPVRLLNANLTVAFVQSLQQHPGMNAHILAHMSHPSTPTPAPVSHGMLPDLPWGIEAGTSDPFPWGRSYP